FTGTTWYTTLGSACTVAFTVPTFFLAPGNGMEKADFSPGGMILRSVNPNCCPIVAPPLSFSRTFTRTPSTGSVEPLRISPTTTGPMLVEKELIETMESRWSGLVTLFLTAVLLPDEQAAA